MSKKFSKPLTDLQQMAVLSLVIGVIFLVGLFAIIENADSFQTEYCTADYCLKEGQTLEQIGITP